MKIIAVDWGKDARKRSAYQADPATSSIRRLETDGSLEHLIEYASSLKAPVLIGIDAAIGFPASSWTKLVKHCSLQARSFIDFLLGTALPGDFFNPVANPEEWLPERPFIRPPRGRWSLKAFIKASDSGLHRHIDLHLNGNPIFVTCGLPGSVGSGTRVLWQELRAIEDASRFRVWPFHGSCRALLKSGIPVIAEIYPKACYGIALAETLPASLCSIAKTRESARRAALEKLLNTGWVVSERIAIHDFDNAQQNEDDFDALMSAAALLRIILEGAAFDSPEVVEVVAEGGVLGSINLTTG